MEHKTKIGNSNLFKLEERDELLGSVGLWLRNKTEESEIYESGLPEFKVGVDYDVEINVITCGIVPNDGFIIKLILSDTIILGSKICSVKTCIIDENTLGFMITAEMNIHINTDTILDNKSIIKIIISTCDIDLTGGGVIKGSDILVFTKKQRY